MDAVEQGFVSQAIHPISSLSWQRMLASDRRISIHSGGCVPLSVAGTFIHYEHFEYTYRDQSYSGVGKRVYVAYNSETAELLAIIVGSLPFYRHNSMEDEFATETAITSAVGTRSLSKQDANVLGLYGTGHQARRHIEALCAIRPIKEVKVYSRSPDNRLKFVQVMQAYIDAEIRPVETPKEAAQNVDIIVCATASNVPALQGRWLEPGARITSIVGSNKELLQEGLVSTPRRELDDQVLAKANVIVATLIQQGIQDEQGDLCVPIKNGIIRWEEISDLSTLLNGKSNGRTHSKEITLFKQNSDQGVGFMTLARLAYDKAREASIDIEI